MVFTTYINDDDWGMVYGIVLSRLLCLPPKSRMSGRTSSQATIELAAEKTTKRHRMSLCKAAETLDLAGSDVVEGLKY